MTAPVDQPKPWTARAALARALPLALLIAAGAGVWWAWGDLLGWDGLGAHAADLLARAEAHPMATKTAFLLLFTLVVALTIPGAFVMTVAGGFLFGLVPGTLLAVVAGTLGAMVVYAAVRAGLSPLVARRAAAQLGPERAARILAALDRDAFRYLLLLRTLPVVPVPVANVLPALVPVRVLPHLVTTMIGLVPGSALSAWIGVAAAQVILAGGKPDVAQLLSPAVLGAFAAATLLLAAPAAIGLVYRRRAGGLFARDGR